MFVFALFMRKQMRRTSKRNRERIGDINARIEDSLSGIRVVKSFANEEIEIEMLRKMYYLIMNDVPWTTK